MSRHEGVSCDACLRSNFRGRRYKCLVCYDYDLCAGCREAGSTTTRHTADHPMQCILTRADAELFYGSEALSAEQPQSFVCPHCGKMGLTELTLADHVTAQHSDTTTQVVCPVCASVPNGEPNHVTEDLTAHLSMDHRGGGGGGGGGSGGIGVGSGGGGGGSGGSRDLISFGDEPSAGSRHTARRMPHPGRGVSGPRIRRFNMHFRESMDPITELLSQLSGVRRAAASTSSASSTNASSVASSASTASQLQQLQMHLQLERQQYAQVVRQHTERVPRRQAG
ncbi:E3 ubiquitin-protein ligase KCMF1-like, partial [Pollicipes pollicipes]|uniref:E3 ubiquitin-protein ligase KCMF1-like n=1 Tax=Pollicipes pollicipes TaxID=41117 RepID=UPI001885629B